MADSKISDLTAGTVAAVDEFPFVQSGTTKVDTIQGILDLVPASSNLGGSDLTSTANNRVFTLNGSTSTNLLTIEVGAGTDIMQFRGDNTVYMPAGNMSIGTTPNSTVRLKVQSDSYGVYSSSMVLADYYASSAAAKNFHAENSKVNGIGIYANMTGGSGVNYGIYGRAIQTSTGTNVGIRAAASGGAINYAFYIDSGDIFLADTTNGCKIGTTTSQKIGFWNTTPIVQPAALTAQLTDITGDITPVTPDYVVTATNGGWGFGSQDEFETAMNVINNLQTRVQELEDALSTAAGGSGLIA